MAAPRTPPLLDVARAGLTAGAAIALTRVFAGGSWLVLLLVGALVPPLAFAVGERRRWHPGATMSGLALAAAWAAVVVGDPSETVAGIPTRAAVVELVRELGNAPHVLRSAVVPVTPVGPALVLAFVAIVAGAALTDVLGRLVESPLGAVAPSLALFVTINALGAGRWASSTACYALVVMAYLVALQHAEVTSRRTWFQSGRSRRSQLASGGFVAGALAIALAVAVGPAFPGARGRAWINYRSLGSGKGATVLNATSPLVSVAAKLNTALSTKEVFTVESPNAYRWRVIALDQYVNGQWGLSASPRSAGGLEGPTGYPDAHIVRQTFHLASIDALWLPAAYRPVRIDVADASVLPDSDTLFVSDRPLQGLDYSVESEVRDPDESVLRSVSDVQLNPMNADTVLPHDFPSSVRKLAHDLTRNATTPYDRAAALERFFFRPDFTYDTKVDLGSTSHALETFLFKTRKGFCEQYATAFAAMARAVDLPTRVAVGYQAGQFSTTDGLWHVRGVDAHAWPEVWLGPSIGWYAFEPTPGRVDPVTHRGRALPAGNANGSTTTTATTPASTTPVSAGANTPPPKLGGVDVQSPRTKTTTGSSRTHVLIGVLVALGVAIAGALSLLVALVIAAIRRTRRRRRDPDTRARVLGAWNEALERLAAAGVEPRPSATALEFALRHAPAHGAGAAGPALMDLAHLQTAALFGDEPPSEEDARVAWERVDAIVDALRQSVPRTDRWAKRLRPRPDLG